MASIGDHVIPSRDLTRPSDDLLTFTQLLDYSRFLQHGTSSQFNRPWYQGQIYTAGNQLHNVHFPPSHSSSTNPIYSSASNFCRSGKLVRTFDIPVSFHGHLLQSEQGSIHGTNLKENSKQENTREQDMALTSGRKLCKLDAICAKLKKINTDKTPTVTSKEHEEIPNGNAKAVDEEPTDLSVKCLNNNIIGKVDLHSVKDQHETEQCLQAKAGNTHQSDNIEVEKPENLSLKVSLAKTSEDEKIASAESITDPLVKTHSDEFSIPAVKVKETQKVTGSSRRKSRKASVPRNISQVRDLYDHIDEKDELAEYEINNLNTNFPPEESEDGDTESKDTSSSEKRTSTGNSTGALDDDSDSSFLQSDKSLNNSNNSRNSLSSQDISDYMNPSGALDLTMHNKSTIKPKRLSNGYENSGDDEHDEDYELYRRKRKLVIDERKHSVSGSTSSSLNSSGGLKRESGVEQAAHLKDFAENTMNELISMYGFGGSGHSGCDISRQIPMKNFSDILKQSQNAQLSSLAAMQVGSAKLKTQPIIKGEEESGDGSQPNKGIYANFPKSSQSTLSKSEAGPKKLQNDRFTTSSSFINALYNSPGSSSQPGEQRQLGKTLLPNYSKYLKRYNTGIECGGQHCKDLSYKEHYHCIDCSFQVFIKKEEMVRHYKWHKKREESLQHGFLRFSPLDNCAKRFGSCTHNGKQTHYHCLQNGCDKVYISTSDVQMHANYHRKDSAIMSEGFQRFRATEDCGTMSCAFYGQRTTHFHCLRSDCKFTFKNKADMEKHKSYHQKDEVLGRDGFKKFMKYEHCNYNGCRYSKVSNHIHCIRSGCDYVLHSTAQLYSHKRKHERRDFESAYKRFRDKHQPGASQIQQVNKSILPRADPSMLQFQAVSGKNAIPSLASMSGLKRPSDMEMSEPLELKKPKMEYSSDGDTPVPSSPAGLSDDESSTVGKTRSEYDQMDTEASNMSECSSDCHPDDFHMSDKYNSDTESINLNGSLNLQVPTLQLKTEPKTETITSLPDTSLASAVTSLALQTSMPSTLTNNIVSLNPGTLMTVPSILTGASTMLQPPKSIYTERREKDDSWKTYLVRYTANDPCNPRCQYLYKDHYHCKVDGCLVLFKSKDGVREHARFHELQDRITPIAYRAYEAADTCPEACQYSKKEKHFHCIWSACTHVVPYVGPTFGRLEHYRIHEYARAAAGKSYNRSTKGTMEDNSMRRRGRPPKYPKLELPKIPKVELSDEEIRLSQMVDSDIPFKMKVVNGFRVFSPEDPCPDDQCSFVGKIHYHCARPRCFTITDRTDVLNLHAKDFHSFVKILEGFEFFDRNVSCRRLHCPNNQTNRHFHCTRPKCDYSFIRHSTMAQHEKKHVYSESGSTSAQYVMREDTPISPTAFRRDIPIKPLPVSGIRPENLTDSPIAFDTHLGQGSPVISGEQAFVPVSNIKQLPNIPLLISSTGQLSAVPQGSVIFPQQGNFPLPQVALTQSSAVSSPTVPLALTVSSVQALPASVTSQQVMAGITTQLLTSIGATAGNTADMAVSSAPLTVLLQRGVNQIPQPNWNDLRAKMHYSLAQNCGRPFCKLKKKDHYHCYDCNQAFSDPSRLRSHIGKHGIKLKKNDQGDQPIKAAPVSTPATETVEGEDNDMDPDEAKCLAEGQDYTEDSETEDELKSSSSLNLNPSTFSEMITKAQEQNKLPSTEMEDEEEMKMEGNTDTDGNQSDSSDLKIDLSSRSGRKITKTKHEGFMNSGEINLTKQRRTSTSMKSGGMKLSTKVGEQAPNSSSPRMPSASSTRSIKDDSVPDGYSRWRYNEECCYPKCAYRHSVTHFHCNREDCGYGFSDRSRLVQHTLRHERIDSITGGELQQYRINQDCDKEDCEFNRKMSHFHCKRCTYSCTDSSKVLTHRKYHAKLDNIANQGFQKYSTVDDCGINLCPYARKQTHFHCLKDTCKAAVLGPTQMSSHKAKHT